MSPTRAFVGHNYAFKRASRVSSLPISIVRRISARIIYDRENRIERCIQLRIVGEIFSRRIG